MSSRASLTGAAVLLLSSLVEARPTVWERARTPRVDNVERTQIAVERMLMRVEDAEGDPSTQRDFVLGGLVMLELGGGAQLEETRLNFLLGRLLASDLVRRDEEAVPILERLVRATPDSPLAGEAWYYLGRACARLREAEQAMFAYGRALALSWDPDLLALAYLHRGELLLQLRRVAEAKESLYAALAHTAKPERVARGYLALAAALERLGDLPSALEAAAAATQVRLPSDVFGNLSILDLPVTDLDPPYERYYREALAQMALADRADSPDAGQQHVLEAIAAWQKYLRAAGPTLAPWSANALRLREMCRRGSLPFVSR